MADTHTDDRTGLRYTIAYSPIDNGWYVEVFDGQGKSVWQSRVCHTREAAVEAAVTYLKRQLTAKE